MAKLSTLLSDLAAKGGINVTDPAFQTFIKTIEDTKEIPDDFAKPLQENLFTLDAAKNNSVLNAHFKGTYMNGLDAEIERTMTELGLDESTINELKAEKSSFKRVGNLAKRLKELEAKKFEGKGGDKAELQKEINELNSRLAKIVADNKAEVETIRANHSNEILNYDIAGHLAGYSYSLPKEMPAEVKTKTAAALLNSELLQKGLRVVKVDGVLRLQKVDGTDYFDASHKKVEFPDFTKQVLDTNKLLAVSTPGSGGGGNPTIITPPANGVKFNPELQAATKQSLADIAR